MVSGSLKGRSFALIHQRIAEGLDCGLHNAEKLPVKGLTDFFLSVC